MRNLIFAALEEITKDDVEHEMLPVTVDHTDRGKIWWSQGPYPISKDM